MTRATSVIATNPGAGAGADRTGAGGGDQKSDAASFAAAREPQARFRVIVGRHHDVLEDVAEAGLDRPLVAGVHLEKVGNRTQVRHVTGGFGQDKAGAVAIFRARGRQLLQRLQPSEQTGELVLPHPVLAAPLLAVGSRTGKLRLAHGAIHAQALDRLAGAGHGFLRRGALACCALGLDPKVSPLDLQLVQLFGDAGAGRDRVLDGVAQRGRGVDRGKHLAAGRLDIRLEPFDAALKIRVRHFLGLHRVGRGGAFGGRPCLRVAARVELEPGRLAPGVERLHLDLDFAGGLRERLDLLPVERDLLLEAADLQLPGVGGFAGGGRVRIRFRQLEPEPLEGGLDFSEVGCGAGFALARRGQPRPRRGNRLPQHPVPARELHLLPPPELVAEPAIPPRLGRLPLQRAALLLDLEDDVVDPRQVLLGSLELELRLPAPALVLGDAGRLFDQLAAIGRAGAEDLADLSLFDDRVGLDAQPGIHQQVLDVAEPAILAVDQVLAFTRTVETTHELDVLDDQRQLVLHRHGGFETHASERQELTSRLDDRPGTAPLLAGRDARRDSGQLQPHFRGGGRLPRIAAAKNHVLHTIAAQALGALFAEDPGERVDDIALAAAVRPDDRRHPLVEGEFGAVRKALEAGDLDSIQSHGRVPWCSGSR